MQTHLARFMAWRASRPKRHWNDVLMCCMNLQDVAWIVSVLLDGNRAKLCAWMFPSSWIWTCESLVFRMLHVFRQPGYIATATQVREWFIWINDDPKVSPKSCPVPTFPTSSEMGSCASGARRVSKSLVVSESIHMCIWKETLYFKTKLIKFLGSVKYYKHVMHVPP